MSTNYKLEDSFVEFEQEDETYILQYICTKTVSVILLEPIISNETYLQKDKIAQIGNLIVEYSEFSLFEYNSRIPEDNICIIKKNNQNYQSTVRKELMKSAKQKNFAIFLKFNCSNNNKRLNQKIKDGKDLINFVKSHFQNNFFENWGQFLNILICKLRNHQQKQIQI